MGIWGVLKLVKGRWHTAARLTLRVTIVSAISGLLMTSWFVRKSLSQPLKHLTSAMDRFQLDALNSSGPGHDDRFESLQKRGDELGVLVRSFTAMKKKLIQSNRELRKAHNELEQRVLERTEELAAANRDLQKAKEAAEAGNKAKSEFLARMSHELRTPLNAILGFAQIMKRDRALTSVQHEGLDIIGRSGEHLLDLINDVLEMSKIEASHSTLTETAFDFHELLESLESIFRFRAQGKGLQLQFEHSPEVPRYIRADERKFRKVLFNLLSNAVKFTDKGQVTLRACYMPAQKVVEKANRQTGRLFFEVEDTGPGIAPEEIGRVFEPFGQTQLGRKTQEGTGLGLSISQRFAKFMGGYITVDSQIGRGSIFKFDIHASEVEPVDGHLGQPERRVTGLMPGQSPRRILVVEDIDENRKFLIKLLETVGLEVREAHDGQEAVEKWNTWEPHLIWMDMNMPIMNGYEATKRIKATAEGLATVIIALTASAFKEDRERILAIGCEDFVLKPFREADIFDKMSKYLGLRYVYEEKDKTPPSAKEMPKLRSADLSALPGQWLASLHNAAVRGNIDEMTGLIEQIKADHGWIAEDLLDLTINFKFEPILAATKSFCNVSEKMT